MFHPYSFYLQKHKNAKIKRESALPFFSFPLLLHLVSVPRCPQTAFYYVPFHHLGYPISPFGMSHFAIWDIPFCHLGYPILPFGVSHFAIWGIPFRHLGCPILPFGMSHFTIWDVPFCLLGYIFGTFAHNVQPDFRFVFFVFSLPKFVFFLSFRFIMFLRDSLGRIKYIL